MTMKIQSTEVDRKKQVESKQIESGQHRGRESGKGESSKPFI